MAAISVKCGNVVAKTSKVAVIDPSGGSDIIFVPVGLDENTFDWGHNNFSEADQLGLWLGDNLNYNTRTVQWTIPATTVGGSGQPGDPGIQQVHRIVLLHKTRLSTLLR